MIFIELYTRNLNKISKKEIAETANELYAALLKICGFIRDGTLSADECIKEIIWVFEEDIKINKKYEDNFW